MRVQNKSGVYENQMQSIGLLRPYDANAGKRKMVILPFNRTPAAGVVQNFESDNELIDVTGIEVVDVTQLVNATLHGVTYTVPNQDQFNEAIIFLVTGQNQVLCSMPLTTLLTTLNAGKLAYFNCKVRWQNCFIRFTGNVSALNTGHAFVFMIHYK